MFLAFTGKKLRFFNFRFTLSRQIANALAKKAIAGEGWGEVSVQSNKNPKNTLSPYPSPTTTQWLKLNYLVGEGRKNKPQLLSHEGRGEYK
jgi:hypothetical protein